MDRVLVRVNEKIEKVSTTYLFHKLNCLEFEFYYFGEF